MNVRIIHILLVFYGLDLVLGMMRYERENYRLVQRFLKVVKPQEWYRELAAGTQDLRLSDAYGYAFL